MYVYLCIYICICICICICIYLCMYVYIYGEKNMKDVHEIGEAWRDGKLLRLGLLITWRQR